MCVSFAFEFVYIISVSGVAVDIRCVYRKPFAKLSITAPLIACLFLSSYLQSFQCINTYFFSASVSNISTFSPSYYLLPARVVVFFEIVVFIWFVSLSYVVVRIWITSKYRITWIAWNRLILIYLESIWIDFIFQNEMFICNEEEKYDFIILSTFLSIYFLACYFWGLGW